MPDSAEFSVEHDARERPEPTPALFACDERGRLVVTSEGLRLLAWVTGSPGPTWTHRFAEPRSEVGRQPTGVFRRPAEPLDAALVGIRCSGRGVFAVDDRGTLKWFSERGELLATVACNVEAFALLATSNDIWAVLHRGGAVVGQRGRILRRFEERAVSSGSFADGGNFLALGTRDGRLVITPIERPGARELELGGSVSGVAWAGRHGWLVARGDAILRVDPSYTSVEPLWLADDEQPLTGVVCADERACGFRRGRHELVVVLLTQRVRLAAIDFAPLELGEFEFGPWPWLGVALGQGEYARIDIDSARVEQNVARARKQGGAGSTALARREGAGEALAKIEIDWAALAAERSRALRERSEPLRQFVVTLGLFALALVVFFVLLVVSFVLLL